MGIGRIASTNNMSVMQVTSANVKDQKSKSIQNEITDVQQQIQKLSSAEELSATEKENEKKKLQKEKSSLDTELKQHQDELLRSQKRQAMLSELREKQNPSKAEDDEAETPAADTSVNTTDKENPSDKEQQALQPGTVISQSSDGTVILKEVMNPAENSADTAQADPAAEVKEAAATTEQEAEEEKTDTDTDPAEKFRPTAEEMHDMVSANTSAQMAGRMGTLVAKTEDGIAILKGEIKQDAYRGTDTERKQAELEQMQKQQERETTFQFSLLSEANNNPNGAKAGTQADTENTLHVSGLHTPQDEQAAEQGFHVAIA